MRKLSRIIWVGPNCLHIFRYKRKAEGDQTDTYQKKKKGNVKMEAEK